MGFVKSGGIYNIGGNRNGPASLDGFIEIANTSGIPHRVDDTDFMPAFGVSVTMFRRAAPAERPLLLL